MDIAEVVAARIAEHKRRGVLGERLYHVLAVDPALPVNLEIADVAMLTGDSPAAFKQRRHRGSGPPFIRLSGRRIVYPTADFFTWLGDRYVGRSAGRAASEYVNQPVAGDAAAREH